jgi:hypothetical protein
MIAKQTSELIAQSLSGPVVPTVMLEVKFTKHMVRGKEEHTVRAAAWSVDSVDKLIDLLNGDGVTITSYTIDKKEY